MSAAIRTESVEEMRQHIACLKTEAAAGRVYDHERELAYYEQALHAADAQQSMPRSERLCCALAYTLLAALGWLIFTHDPYPLAIAGISALAASYAQETAKK